ncbi:MAG: hypothetical protein PHG97_05790, partial [Candidatus Margulisbacteria bacterium]|nr:hypothetical protein [Candidatus Margulisiibacteriota bacterium]
PATTTTTTTTTSSTTTTLMGGSIQGSVLSLEGTVTTFAGTAGSAGSIDATGIDARFNQPNDITTDGTNLYITDMNDNLIRKIVIATGAVTTLAGTGSFGSADGTGTAASFFYPQNITTDGTNLFVTDYKNTIRKIVITTGVVTTLVGSAGASGSADGTGAAARFNSPTGITTDGTNLYVTDMVNHTIRKIVIATEVVTTIAGTAGISGSADGTGAAARFNRPRGITTDGNILYVSDSTNSTIRKIDLVTLAVTTIIGTPGSYGTAEGIGTAAQVDDPRGLAFDGTNLYIVDYSADIIRKFAAGTGMVTTIAGNPYSAGSTDGKGTAALFKGPSGVTTDGKYLYITDNKNHTIRKIR